MWWEKEKGRRRFTLGAGEVRGSGEGVKSPQMYLTSLSWSGWVSWV